MSGVHGHARDHRRSLAGYLSPRGIPGCRHNGLVEEQEPGIDRPLSGYYRRIKAGRQRSGSMTVALGAAMIAVGEILEPDKTAVEIEQTSNDPLPDGFDLTFDGLPELD